LCPDADEFGFCPDCLGSSAVGLSIKLRLARDGLPSSVELGARLREVEGDKCGARRGDGDEWVTGCDELSGCDDRLCDCDDDRECDVDGASEFEVDAGTPRLNGPDLLALFTPSPFSLDAVLVGVAI
jgi:hypothetical protein